MSKATTRAYTIKMRQRYLTMQAKVAKGRILDELCTTTGLERKHANKVLLSNHEPLRSAGRTPIYTDASQALASLWMMFDCATSPLMSFEKGIMRRHLLGEGHVNKAFCCIHVSAAYLNASSATLSRSSPRRVMSAANPLISLNTSSRLRRLYSILTSRRPASSAAQGVRPPSTRLCRWFSTCPRSARTAGRIPALPAPFRNPLE